MNKKMGVGMSEKSTEKESRRKPGPKPRPHVGGYVSSTVEEAMAECERLQERFRCSEAKAFKLLFLDMQRAWLDERQAQVGSAGSQRMSASEEVR